MYLTEDALLGRLYRFIPARRNDLSVGRLEAAVVVDDRVSWRAVNPDEPDRSPETTPFAGGEGAVIDAGRLLFATKIDRRIWELDIDSGRLVVFHDALSSPGSPLTHVDGIAVHPKTNHVFVAEDRGDMGLCLLATWDGKPTVAQVVQFDGHAGSEVTGAAFSPDGRSLFLSSQRGFDGRGITIRITGPFDEAFDHVANIDRGATVNRQAHRLSSD